MMTRPMTGPGVSNSTALSPEWDRWFDEAFTDLISGDEDLVRNEFDALIAASWQPPPPPPPPAPSVPVPSADPPAGPPPASQAQDEKAVDAKGGDDSRGRGFERSPPGAVTPQ